MFKSRYNVEVERDSGETLPELLLFNTANGAFASLEGDALKSYMMGTDLPDGGLAKNGFLTPMSPEEELEIQRRNFDIARGGNGEFSICILPTYVCNYRCPYCYEVGHNSIGGKLTDEVADAIYKYMERSYAAKPFKVMTVQWYGGDPSLCLDVVESLSKRFIDFCDSHNVVYSAMMLTNCNLIDEKAVDLLKRCKVTGVLVTIDGLEETHNKRRVAADGSNSFERNMNAVHLFKQNGIDVFAGCNIDKVNWKEYPELKHMLMEKEGVSISANKLNDYGSTFGTGEFKEPDFDLFTHEEFFQAQHDLLAEEGLDAQTLRQMLRPVGRFCRGQLDSYINIDPTGDVYKCDGVVGEKDQVMFNILDEDVDPIQASKTVTFDATRDPKCSECNILPICQGSCYWERSRSGMPCHPLKTTMDQYLNDYRNCFDLNPDNREEFELLAQPFDPDDVLAL
ncbi:MAG: radical SAM protein [Coriobacteriales bacterium]|jgi:uncharacterized protein